MLFGNADIEGAVGEALLESINAGAMNSRLIVVLNDNDMSIAPPVGAMSAYLSRLMSSHSYHSIRHVAQDIAKLLPRSLARAAAKAEAFAKSVVTGGGTLFEEMGFYYVGPIDGHNLDHLLPVLRNARDWSEEGPILVHVRTRKGAGYAPAEATADKYHAVTKFDVVTGAQSKPVAKAPSYTGVFAKALIAEAEVVPEKSSVSIPPLSTRVSAPSGKLTANT